MIFDPSFLILSTSVLANDNTATGVKLSVSLDPALQASMAMMPQMSLTKFQQVIFLARVSASGNAMPQAGDLIGLTSVLEWQKLDKPVSIVINK